MSELTVKFVAWCWHRTLQVDSSELLHLCFCYPKNLLVCECNRKVCLSKPNICICATDNLKLLVILTRLFLDCGRTAEHLGQNCEVLRTDKHKGIVQRFSHDPHSHMSICIPFDSPKLPRSDRDIQHANERQYTYLPIAIGIIALGQFAKSCKKILNFPFKQSSTCYSNTSSET